MNALETRFLALEPDEPFARQVLRYKDRVRRAVGEQRYLGDPPHLTLYVGVFGAGVDLHGPVGDACSCLAAPTVTIHGWHVFEADQLTGNYTVVCDVTPDSRPALQQMQREVIAAVAPLRDARAARACYDKSWHLLSDAERANVERVGFPFAGRVWHPHVTVASVRPEDWAQVWSELARTPPDAVVRFPQLAVYALDGNEPLLVERFALEGVE